MRHITLLAALAVLWTSTSWCATEIHSLQQLAAAAEPGSVVVLDIDNTMLRPAQSLGSDQWFDHYLGELTASGRPAAEALSQAQRQALAVMNQSEYRLTEPGIPALIAELRDKHVEVLALTARNPGMAEPTLRQLAAAGIRLSPTAEVPPSLLPEGTKVRGGVIFVGPGSKGEALDRYLRVVQLDTRKILFADDKARNAAAFEKYFHGRKAAVFRYSGSDRWIKSFDPAVAAEELRYLNLSGKLESDADAHHRLSGRAACSTAFAELRSPFRKIVALSAGAHVAGLGAYSLLRPKPPVEQPQPPTRSEAEKYFSPDEPLPASRLLPREEIVKRATDIVARDAKNEGSEYKRPETLIQSEIASKSPPDLALLGKTLRQFRRDQAVIQRTANRYGKKQLEKIEAAVAYLHRNYFRHYCRDRGHLSDFLGPSQCGNCQSNTKLVLAHLQAAGISPPDGYEYGAQLYADHIAPVLIEKKTHRVLDLVTNEEQEKPHAPVYRPSVIFHALLTTMQAKPPVELASLLIAAGDPAALGGPVADNGKVDSNTVFAGGAGSFGKGKPVPDRADMPRGALGDGMLAREKEANGYRAALDYVKVKVAVVKEDKSLYDLTVDADKNTISVSPEIAELCKAELFPTVTLESYHVCQDKRAHRNLDRLFATPAGKLLQEFARHPERAAKYSAEDLRSMANVLEEMNRQIRAGFSFNRTFHTLLTPHPMLDKVFDMIRNLDDKLTGDPTTFLKFLDGLPAEKRAPVGRLLAIQSYRDVYSFVQESDSELYLGSHPGYTRLRKLLFNDQEVFVYRPKTKLGPKDMVLLLDGDLNTGYRGYLHQPEGQQDTFAIPQTKDKSPDGKTGNDPRGGGIDQEVETKLRLAPATMAALLPLLDPGKESPESYDVYPDGRGGAGKYFTGGVVQAFIDSQPTDAQIYAYETMAKLYFNDLEIRDFPDENQGFFQLFGQEKFFSPSVTSRDKDTGDVLGGDSFGGPYPDYLAKAIQEGEKKIRSKWKDQSKFIKTVYELEPFNEPIIREGDLPGPDDDLEPADGEYTPADSANQ